jgi:tetratricopeptide (TPR) repeat protein
VSDGFECTVRVEQTGTMQMPIPVLARFEDGTEQRVSTERLAKTQALRFRAKSRLASVELDPDKAVAMAEPPGAAERELRSKLRELPWSGGSGDSALELYKETRALKLEDPDVWIKLALSLYDARSYREALEAAAELERGETNYRFAGLVWQGHILDLMNRRGEAVARYTEALKVPGSPGMQHGQYKLTINKDWVERRLKDPFTRP